MKRTTEHSPPFNDSFETNHLIQKFLYAIHVMHTYRGNVARVLEYNITGNRLIAKQHEERERERRFTVLGSSGFFSSCPREELNLPENMQSR